MDQIWKRIESIAEEGNGFLLTSQVENAGVSRPMLKKYVDDGKLERVRKGIYVITDVFFDEYSMLQSRFSKMVFSYGTALYLWGMSDRTPHFIDITVPQGSNTTVMRRNNRNLRCHYVQPEVYDLGITTVQTPQGGTVRLYDKERCICDIIKAKDQMEMQLYTQAIKEYFKKKPNSRKLLKYGKIFKIEDKIRTYMEVLL